MSTECFIQQQHNRLFSAAHGTFSEIDHILRHKYEKIEITPCILSDYNAITLELFKNNSRKYRNNWRLNNTLYNDQWVIEEIREEIKMFLEVNENETMIYQNLWDTAKEVLRGKFIAMSAYIKRSERAQIKDLMLHLKHTAKQNKQNLKQAKGEKK
jgi:hypothetical protein